MFAERLEYILKHNTVAQKFYRIFFSFVFKVLGLFIKVNPKQVIISSLIGKNYGDSMKVLYDEMRKNPKFEGYTYVWAFDDPAKYKVDGDAKKVKLVSPSYYIEALRSGIWLSNVSIERGLHFKPKKTIYLNTWHAMAINYVGNALNGRKDYDFSDVGFMCCGCDYEAEVFIRDFLVRKEALVKCGMPRNDWLYNITDEDKIEMRKRIGLPLDKRIIFVAPTWRDSPDGGKTYPLDFPIDWKLWEENLSDEYIILFRKHHITTDVIGLEFNEFVRDMSSYPNINDLYVVSDILISDFSSTLMDFSILERPIISFAYDFDEYSKGRGFYRTLEELFNNCVYYDQKSLLNHILTFDWNEECEKARVVKATYMKGNGGHATEACIKYLEEHIIDNK